MYRVFDLPRLILFPKIDVKSNVNEDSINLAFILIQERPCKLRVYCINLLMMEIWRFSCNYRCSLPNGRLKSTTLLFIHYMYIWYFFWTMNCDEANQDPSYTLWAKKVFDGNKLCNIWTRPERAMKSSKTSLRKVLSE